MRPDDLTALVVRTVLAKLPELDPRASGPHGGCGQPAGESGFNVARVAALLAGLPNVPGVTVNRYLLVVTADHSHGRARDSRRRG